MHGGDAFPFILAAGERRSDNANPIYRDPSRRKIDPQINRLTSVAHGDPLSRTPFHQCVPVWILPFVSAAAASSTMSKRLIARPLKLVRGRALPNRIAKSALSEALGTMDNRVTPGLVRRYRRWGAGGADVDA